MSQTVFRARFSDGPQDLPSVKDIINECTAAYEEAYAADESGDAANNLRGIHLKNGSAFVKFGNSVELREAEIQHHVYKFLSTIDPRRLRVARVYQFIITARFRYLVMELIDGSTCSEIHVPQIARALEQLIEIRAPTMAPGPVRPGPIDHCFFDDNVSSVAYPTVSDLQTHLNNILVREGHTDRLDLVGEVKKHGLRLCPSDMDPSNFMVDLDGMIVALDFGQTSFLPSCFFYHAITVNKPFTNLLAREVKYPKYPTPERNHLDALQKAGYLLVIGSNNYGLPNHLRPKPTEAVPKSAGSGK